MRKKDGSLRIIFDTRILNLKFKDPPKTRLPTAAAFASVEASPGKDTYIGSGDIRNAFYAMEVPDELSDLFSLLFVRAGDVNASQIDGVEVSASTVLVPCLSVLPMGWSWSLSLCQQVVHHGMTTQVNSKNMISDKEIGRVISDDNPTIGAAYVDNFCVIGSCKHEVDRVLEAVTKHFTKFGFLVHEQQSASPCGEFVGLEFNRGSFSIKAKRIWRLKFALEHVLRMPSLSGRALEIII